MKTVMKITLSKEDLVELLDSHWDLGNLSFSDSYEEVYLEGITEAVPHSAKQIIPLDFVVIEIPCEER